MATRTIRRECLDVIAQLGHNVFQFSQRGLVVGSRLTAHLLTTAVTDLTVTKDVDNVLRPHSRDGGKSRWTVAKDVDDVSRPVVAVGATTVSKDWEHARHQHRKAQLLYSVRGILNCEIEDGIWIVPPQCAVWIPGDLPHSARGSGETECYCLFVEPEAAPDLPKTCCTISVSPLLRELLLKAVGFPELYALGSREDRLIATLLDELAAAPVEDLHLPMPRDPRLRRLAEMLLIDPTDKRTMGDWAIRIGMSERSMSRLLQQEIGMSFGRWRRQLHVILSLQRLTKGESVQTVALELGYENASGFVTMFRKSVGKPPARYLSDRTTGAEYFSAPGIVFPDPGPGPLE